MLCFYVQFRFAFLSNCCTNDKDGKQSSPDARAVNQAETITKHSNLYILTELYELEDHGIVNRRSQREGQSKAEVIRPVVFYQVQAFVDFPACNERNHKRINITKYNNGGWDIIYRY